MASKSASCERGWQVGKSLTQCLSHMLEEEVDCDVSFQIQSPDGSVTRLSAHKFMLTARSPVFEAMLSGSYVESRKDVVIVDIDKQTFNNLLQYLYTEKVNMNADNVLHLLYASKKYMLEDLEEKCQIFLKEMLNENNACILLSEGLRYKEDTLAQKCLHFISPRIQSICKTDGFNKMSHEALLRLLRCNTLYHGSEIPLYKACVTWAKKRISCESKTIDEEIRSILGDCVHHFRFSLMKPTDFAAVIGTLAVLTDTEKSLFYGLLLNPNGNNHEKLTHLGFNMSSRLLRCSMSQTPDPSYSYNFGNVSGHGGTIQEEKFKFNTDKSIKLLGFTIPGSGQSSYDVKLGVCVEDCDDCFDNGHDCFDNGQRDLLLEDDPYDEYDPYCGDGPNFGEVLLETNKAPQKEARSTLHVLKTTIVADSNGCSQSVFLDEELDIPAQKSVCVTALVSGGRSYSASHSYSATVGQVTFNIQRQQSGGVSYNSHYHGYSYDGQFVSSITEILFSKVPFVAGNQVDDSLVERYGDAEY